MKKTQKKKGFSLIELIIVISVIAAIAAVIVPQMGNFSSAAQDATNARNVQTWNQVYLNAIAIAEGTDDTVTAPDPSPSASQKVGSIDEDLVIGSGTETVRFYAPGFTLEGDATMTFAAATGLTLD